MKTFIPSLILLAFVYSTDSKGAEFNQEIYDYTRTTLKRDFIDIEELSRDIEVSLDITSFEEAGAFRAFFEIGWHNKARIASCVAKAYTFKGTYKISVNKTVFNEVQFTGFTIDRNSVAKDFPNSVCLDSSAIVRYTEGIDFSIEAENRKIRTLFSRDDIEHVKYGSNSNYVIKNMTGEDMYRHSSGSVMILASKNIPLFEGERKFKVSSFAKAKVHFMQNEDSRKESLLDSIRKECHSGDFELPDYFVVPDRNLNFRLYTPHTELPFYGEVSPVYLEFWADEVKNSAYEFSDPNFLAVLDEVGLSLNIFKRYNCGGIVDFLK